MAGRFAPSPTADLHVGNLRTALVAWMTARWLQEPFLIRIEDLDTARIRDCDAIASRQLGDLATLGLTNDGPVVRQSERFGLYAEALDHLDVYECFCSRKDVAEVAMAPHGATPFYPGTCRNLTEQEREHKRKTRTPCLRVNAHDARTTVHDMVHGDVTGRVDDFVVRRADGVYAYNLAVVVDDGLQQMTHVVRGDDLLESSPRQAWLASQLGFVVPTYLHIPLVYAADGTRLAKRDGAIGLRQLADMGIDAPHVVDILARSLNLAESGEHVTLPALVERFEPKLLPRGPWLTDPATWRAD